MQKILSISLNPAIDISCDATNIRPTVKIRTHNQVQHPVVAASMWRVLL